MDKLYDFTNAKRVIRSLGGTDRKYMVELNGKRYMLKFTEAHAKQTDMSTSYVNSVTAEYISSHIAQSTGLPAHNTLLGYVDDEVVVACEDFRTTNEENIEFKEFVRAIFTPNEINRVIRLDQIYETINHPDTIPQKLKEASIERYWDTFVIDALVGNFDRHTGNWGFLVNNQTGDLRLAPTYDYGSTLLPQLSDEGMQEIINDEHKMLKRCFVFPSPALFITKEKSGKAGYYDLLSSGFDKNCTKAVKKMVPKIDMSKIENILDETPILSDTKRKFYKKYLKLRKETILDVAYDLCINHNYDISAKERIEKGIQFSDEMLDRKIKENKMIQKVESMYSQNECKPDNDHNYKS